MSPAARRGILIGGVLTMIAIVVAGVLVLRGGGSGAAAASAGQSAQPEAAPGPPAPDPASAARQYLRALAAGDLQAASTLTDSPAAAFQVLADGRDALRPTAVRTSLRRIGAVSGNGASATYTAAWTFGAGHVWSYPGTFGLVRIGRNWRVHWTPAVLYPTLRAGQRLALVTKAADHPAVVDRAGRPLVIAGADGSRLADDDFALLRAALVGRVPSTSSRTFAIERVDAEGNDLEKLFGTTTGEAKPARSTLSVAVQSAAQSVVDGYPGAAVIVAMRSDGDLLAAARNVRSPSSPFSGLYAPGSTFKIVTATAAMEAGIASEKTELACPSTETIGTRTIHNDDGFGLGTVPMHRAFARSCNTTFGRLAFQLPAAELVDAAGQFGLNADFAIPGLDTQTGRVVPAADADQLVEDGIGQGAVQVSPFGEALMAATVAAGHPVTPRLWRDTATDVTTGYTAPPAEILAPLRAMMREVVTSGTATGLARSGLVYGKTGTAQFGTGEDANGWFVGYRDDLAFAVLLVDANTSTPAVTLAERFLAKVG